MHSSEEADGWDDEEGLEASGEDPREAEAAERMRRLNMRRTDSAAAASSGARGFP